MPVMVVSISGKREGTYVVLEAVLPGRKPQNIGVLLIDPATGRGWIKMRRNYDQIASPEDAEVLEALEGDMRARIAELGGAAYLEWLEDSLSNTVRIGERQRVSVDAFTRALDRVYGEHVEA